MNLLSKNNLKFIATLQNKKSRETTGLFVVEGTKMVSEIISSKLVVKTIVATKEWFLENPISLSKEVELFEAELFQLEKMSSFRTPQSVLAVAEIPQYQLDTSIIENELVLYLDTIQDPGNFGTILRVADWFGIRNVIASPASVDAFNPKTVQATMGAINRVSVHYEFLSDVLKKIHSSTIKVYGTFLNGKNIYDESLSKAGIIVLGNESVGISELTSELVTDRLFIPSFVEGTQTSESLNVGTAAAIVCSEFRRRIF